MRRLYGLILLLLTACNGYHIEVSPFVTDSTIEIKNIPGDEGGKLMIALANTLVTIPDVELVRHGAKHELEVQLIENAADIIGYEYDRTPISGDLINRLRTNEGRIVLSAKVTLLNKHTGKKIAGPVILTSRRDYDFSNFDTVQDLSFINPAGQRQRILEFSQGQLDTRQGATLVAHKLAMNDLAQKITEFITTL